MSAAKPSERDRLARSLTSRASLLGLGWQIATTLLIFTGGGYALDRWLGTLPWFLLIGAALGMVGVFIQIFRIAAELDRQEKERKANLNS
ncbi:MAG: AtpZ/AtpI family protein [Rhodothermales bacterium]